MLACALAGCGSGGPIDGPYRHDITDVVEDANVCFELKEQDCVERVGPAVFAVGSNDAFVVAARHPAAAGGATIDRSRTEYFYIVRALDGPRKDPADAVRGPFSQAQFEEQRARMALPDFSREISSLK
jgi:predicted small lipoprotein YifL